MKCSPGACGLLRSPKGPDGTCWALPGQRGLSTDHRRSQALGGANVRASDGKGGRSGGAQLSSGPQPRPRSSGGSEQRGGRALSAPHASPDWLLSHCGRAQGPTLPESLHSVGCKCAQGVRVPPSGLQGNPQVAYRTWSSAQGPRVPTPPHLARRSPHSHRRPLAWRSVLEGLEESLEFPFSGSGQHKGPSPTHRATCQAHAASGHVDVCPCTATHAHTPCWPPSWGHRADRRSWERT